MPISTLDTYLSLSASSSDTRAKPAKLRKYDDSYLEFGFIENNDGRTKCIICLATEAMKPVKLKWYLTTRHPEFKDKPKGFFFSERVRNTCARSHEW